MSILYNFSFKYDRQDTFFKALIIRSKQLDDKFVYRKFIDGLMRLDKAFNKDFNKKTDVYKKIQNAKFTNEYLKKSLLDNVYKIKLDDNCFAKKYIDLYGRPFDELNDKAFIKFSTPNNLSYALKITNPQCKTKIDRSATNCGMGYIDINGKTEPNQLGVDLFDVGIYYYGNKKGPDDNNVVSVTTLYWKNQYYGYCLYGNGKGCTYSFIDNISRDNYLLTPLWFKSKYKFNNYYNHIYITPKGKIVFFNNSGFVDFVTVKGLLENIQLYRNYLILIRLKPIFNKYSLKKIEKKKNNKILKKRRNKNEPIYLDRIDFSNGAPKRLPLEE